LQTCSVPGCPDLTTGTRCDAHARAARRQEDFRRGTRTERGLDNRWLRLRDSAVRAHVREHGWICPGYGRESHAVDPGDLTGDHIIPRSLAPERRLDPTNVAVLCLSCNAAKGNR
jgi:5-methylcytosine-specific restriction protein A